MQGLTLTTPLVKKPQVTQIWVDQELIIMDATSQTYFSFNVMGAKIWFLFNIGATSIMDVAQYLQKEYLLEEQKSIQDAQQFIELLLANHILQSFPSPARESLIKLIC
ncbi:MAG: PqqD family protein [Gammaproteobacteria bacterium]|nr:PqqD family protein [Gammaproteobacteria bacterium]